LLFRALQQFPNFAPKSVWGERLGNEWQLSVNPRPRKIAAHENTNHFRPFAFYLPAQFRAAEPGHLYIAQ